MIFFFFKVFGCLKMKLANDINEWLDFSRVMKFVKFGNLI